MATRDFSKYFLYRWRYVIGYSIIGLVLAALLVFAGIFFPGALSENEKIAVVRSASLSIEDPSSLAIQNLPYYAFQAGIFALFGISTFTIKLPSLILALASALGLIMLLRRWFKPNIAVLTSFIAISTGQFLFIAQSGMTSILYVFWPIILLLLGTQVTRVKRLRFLWKILFALSAGLSLYTPLSIYPLLAIVLAIILHPHLRNAVRKLSKVRLAIVSVIFLATIAPLVYFVSTNPSLGLTLLGVPSNWPPNLTENVLTVLRQYFLFWDPNVTTVMTPVFGLGSALIIVLGLYRIIRTRDTTRSYLVIIWLACLIPVLLLNPAYTSVTFLPSMLLLAAGLTSLIGYWYRLFPLNPYARILGLVPIIILVAALISTGLARYLYGYHYDANIVPTFSRDLTLLPADTKQLVVSADEKEFYEAVNEYRNFEVVSKPSEDTFTATKEARKAFEGYRVTKIVTSSLSNEADRFYVYERVQQ